MKIAVFYHIYQYGPWQEIFNEQWRCINESNLFHSAELIHMGINGKIFEENSSSRINIKFNKNPKMEESDTLKDLATFARNNQDYKILYIHTKGVSNYSETVNDWRNMMNYFCIEKWRDCVELLNTYDAVGCNLTDMHVLHFSGNFWWANAEYINKLDYCFLEDSDRFSREFWIGTGCGNLYEIHGSRIDHYLDPYPKKIYAND